MLAEPVPNSAMFVPFTASTMATMRKLVSESFSGTLTTASPLASSTTLGFQSSSVSNSSRAGNSPPPPPAGAAFLP